MLNKICYDFAIIGGGIVGLATGMVLSQTYPKAKILVLEKESTFAFHQTGHNSGVIHSGIYYKPNSFKAKFAKDGNKSMIEFCKQNHIKHEICGKIIVAFDKKELEYLNNLYQRGIENGLEVKKLSKEELQKIEPNVNGLEALLVPSVGIVNFKDVADCFADNIYKNGGDLHTDSEVKKISFVEDKIILETNKDEYECKFFINCAGLQSDKIVEMSGIKAEAKIIPFRGEYYKLKEEKAHLVKGLIYPTPNPNFPFLGVHFTRMINNEVHVGPNAVLGLKREAYKKTDINVKDTMEILTYKGFWIMAFKNMIEGLKEMLRSFNKDIFTKNVQKLIPEIQKDDLIPVEAGVRAQALKNDGSLVDDFLIISGKNYIHVCNAPSPAATSSIEIGKYLVEKIKECK